MEPRHKKNSKTCIFQGESGMEGVGVVYSAGVVLKSVRDRGAIAVATPFSGNLDGRD